MPPRPSSLRVLAAGQLANPRQRRAGSPTQFDALPPPLPGVTTRVENAAKCLDDLEAR